jgi:hypothetical protein
MHPEALRGVQWGLQASGLQPIGNPAPPAFHRSRYGAIEPFRCLDVGGADVNGSARRIVDTLTRRVNNWTGLDIAPGPGVDIVADARKPVLGDAVGAYDLVMCTEVFEHVQDWSSIVISIFDWLTDGGVALMTCASTGRRPHGARGAMDPEPGEWYKNVPELHVLDAMAIAGFNTGYYETKYQAVPGDCYAWARKGE